MGSFIVRNKPFIWQSRKESHETKQMFPINDVNKDISYRPLLNRIYLFLEGRETVSVADRNPALNSSLYVATVFVNYVKYVSIRK